MSYPCKLDRNPITDPDATLFRVGDVVRIIVDGRRARVVRVLDVGGFPLYLLRTAGRAAGGWFADELAMEA